MSKTFIPERIISFYLDEVADLWVIVSVVNGFVKYRTSLSRPKV